jgi:hypothetical protein
MPVSDFAIFADATQGPVRIALPEASNEGKIVFIQKVDDTGNPVFVRCLEGDSTSSGDSLKASDRWDGWTLMADGVKTWVVISTSSRRSVSDAGR